MEKQPLNRIKVMLAERMLTNKQLAEMLGKDPATISKWVTNTSQPTLENLIEIARCLKCDMNDLVRLDDVVTIKQINKLIKKRLYANKQECATALPDTGQML